MKHCLSFLLLLIPVFLLCQSVDSVDIKKVDSLIQLSRDFTESREFDKAMEVNDEAEKIALEKTGRESAAYGSCCFNHGRIEYKRGNYEEAVKWYLESLEIRESTIGKDHAEYAQGLSNLGVLYSDLGQYNKARMLQLEAKEIRESVFGQDHQKYGESLQNLGIIYLYLGQYDKVEPLFIRAKEIIENSLGKEGKEYAGIKINLAAFYIRTRQYNKAESHLLESMGIMEKVLGKEHINYIISRNNLSSLYLYQGQYEKAEPILLESLEIIEKVLGKEHVQYSNALSMLGTVYSELGQYEKAASLKLETISISKKVHGIDHPNYARDLISLANLFREMEKYEKAEPLYLQAIIITKNTLGKEHPQFYACQFGLGRLYLLMSQYQMAESFLLDAKSSAEKIYGRESKEYIACLSNLGVLYHSLGKYGKAETYLLEDKSISEKIFGIEHSRYAMPLNNLGGIYSELGQYEKAEAMFKESLEVIEKVDGKENVEYAISLSNLSEIYRKIKQYEKAEEVQLESLAIRENILGKEHPEYALELGDLALVYMNMGQNKKSEALLLESLEILRNISGEEHPKSIKLLNNLGVHYLWMDQNEEAESCFIQGLHLTEKTLGKMHPENINFLHNIAIANWKLGYDDEVKICLLELSQVAQNQIQSIEFYLSEYELNKYLNYFLIRQDLILSLTGLLDNKSLDSVCFDNSLFYKGFLLKSVNRLKRLAQTDSVATQQFNELKSLHRRLATQYALPVVATDSAMIAQLELQAYEIEKELARAVSDFEKTNRHVSWQDVQAVLNPGDATVEFIHYKFNNMLLPYSIFNLDPDSTFYVAMILRPGDSAPDFIHLFEEKQLDSLLYTSGQRKADYVNSLYTISERGGVPLDQSQKSLYDLIWEPLSKEMEGVETIYFSPSGLLHRLNLAAIPINDEESLGDHYKLVRLNSTRQLVIKNEIESNEYDAIVYGGIEYEMDSTAIIASNQDYSSELIATRGELSFAYTDSSSRGGRWNYLSWTDKEVDQIGSTLSAEGFNTELRKGYSATEESFKSIGSGQPSPRVIHLATHGYFFPDPESVGSRQLAVGSMLGEAGNSEPIFKISEHPMIRSGLIMAGGNYAWKTGKPIQPGMEDGILTAYEISQIDLSHTELVVLSACETGLGDIEGNEGVYGLQRAFKIAGAKYLIMSLWQVPDRETMEFMKTFYSHWLEDEMEIPEAFRVTQLEMRDRFLNPYAWAGFVLVE